MHVQPTTNCRPISMGKNKDRTDCD